MPCPHAATAQLDAHVEAASFCRADAAGPWLARYPAYADGVAWLEAFIARPHAELRRPGAVCPFVAPAMQRGLLHFAIGRRRGDTAADAFAALAPLRDIFAAMPPTEGPERALKSLVVFFPDLPADRAADFIDGGHRLLKPWFIEAGLMIGEFHPESAVPGSTNPEFHPMRAPVPAFALRHMSFHDLRFLAAPGDPPAARARELHHYLAHIGPSLPARQRREAEAMLAEIREPVPAFAD